MEEGGLEWGVAEKENSYRELKVLAWHDPDRDRSYSVTTFYGGGNTSSS